MLSGEDIDATVLKVFQRCCTFAEMTGTITAENVTLITQHQLWTIPHDSDDVVLIAGMVARMLRKRGIKVTP